MNMLHAIILGIIQGITEWLPISSSGHLAIIQTMLGLKPPLFFDVMLHVGTLLVIIAVFWKDVVKMIWALLKLDFKNSNGKMAIFIILGSIPTALIGYFFHDIFESFFSNLFAIGAALIITGIILFISKFAKENRLLNYKDSILIGIAQGISIIPGISRSGLTISIGLFRNIKRIEAAKFSFLLLIPAVIGAAVYESNELVIGNVDIASILIGTVVAVITGYISLKLLLRMIIERRFYLFSYYCWIVGILVILLATLM